MTCAIVRPVTDLPASDEPMHRSLGSRATATLMDLVDTARDLEAAIISGESAETVTRIRDVAMGQAEAYLDLTAQAATHVRALKP